MPRLILKHGSLSDFEALAPLHHRPARPATIRRILTAHEPGCGPARCPLGVLVVSMPVLNGPWRGLAWPGVFDTGCRKCDARRLNHPRLGVRCISRVIVRPEWRGRGIATRLVRAYLRRPLTRRTEAIVSSSFSAGFFDRAGMRRYTLPPSPDRARLFDLFAQHGVDPSRPEDAARLIDPFLLGRELRRWACRSRIAPRRGDADLLATAARALAPFHGGGTSAFAFSTPKHAHKESGVARSCHANTMTRSIMYAGPRRPLGTARCHTH